MPARVVVQSGISSGSSHWIERNVIRIGSDPKSDICLPSADVPAHALTLEFRDGRYRVYNRSRTNVALGPRLVEPGKALVWSDTDILQLNGGIELVLDVEDDPAPTPTLAKMADYDYVEEEEASDVAETETPESSEHAASNSKFLLQLAVTVLCLLGCVGLIARESLKGKGDRRVVPSFGKIILSARDAQASPALIQRLQFAESAAIRGNRKSARHRFGALRDDLILQEEDFVKNSRAAEMAILDFVEYRLGQLD